MVVGKTNQAPKQFLLSVVRKESEMVWHDDICGNSIRAGLVLWGVTLGVWLFYLRRLSPQVPLFYSRPWGEMQLTVPANLGLLAGVSFMVLIVNNLVAGRIFGKDKLLARIISAGGTLVSFLLAIALVRILLLVT